MHEIEIEIEAGANEPVGSESPHVRHMSAKAEDLMSAEVEQYLVGCLCLCLCLCLLHICLLHHCYATTLPDTGYRIYVYDGGVSESDIVHHTSYPHTYSIRPHFKLHARPRCSRSDKDRRGPPSCTTTKEFKTPRASEFHSRGKRRGEIRGLAYSIES